MIHQHRSTHTGHDDIRQHKIGAPRCGLEKLHGALSSGRRDNLVTLIGQHGFDKSKDVGVVIDDEHHFGTRTRIFGRIHWQLI